MAKRYCVWCGKRLSSTRPDARHCSHSHQTMYFNYWRDVRQQMQAQIPLEEFLREKAIRECREARQVNDGS